MYLDVNAPRTSHELVDAHIAELHRDAAVRRRRSGQTRPRRSLRRR